MSAGASVCRVCVPCKEHIRQPRADSHTAPLQANKRNLDMLFLRGDIVVMVASKPPA